MIYFFPSMMKIDDRKKGKFYCLSHKFRGKIGTVVTQNCTIFSDREIRFVPSSQSGKKTLVKIGFFGENKTKMQRIFFCVLTYPIIHTCPTILPLVIVIIIITLDRKNVVQRRRSS